jgi:putative transposase
VGWARERYQLAEHRACRALVVHRALLRYQSRRRDDTTLRRRLRELAHDRLTYGQLRLHVLLRREGWPINKKRVHRLYVEEGLQLVPRRRRRRKAAAVRQVRPLVTTPNTRWAMDFMQDALADGTKFRVFTCVDVATRECVVLAAARRFTADDVVTQLTRATGQRGQAPTVIQCDNGTEFTGLTLDLWAWGQGIQLDFSRPGKPVDNAVCEAFNGSVRRECLTLHWFASLADAQHRLGQWQDDYNNFRPHRSLGHRTPSGIPRDGGYRPRTLEVAS